MTIDLTQFALALLGLASAAITAAIPIVVPAVLKRLHVANDADLSNKLDVAATAAAGAAYKFAAGLADQGGLSNVNVHNAALAMAAQYVAAKMPDTLAQLGVTPSGVHDMVSARLGSLLAVDPTVTAGKPAPANDDTPAVALAPPVAAAA